MALNVIGFATLQPDFLIAFLMNKVAPTAGREIKTLMVIYFPSHDDHGLKTQHNRQALGQKILIDPLEKFTAAL